MLLIIDIGNTNIKFSFFNEIGIDLNNKIYLLPNDSNIKFFLNSNKELNIEVSKIIYSSVLNENKTKSIINEFKKNFNTEAIDSSTIKNDVEIDIHEKKENVGFDLIADIIAANYLSKKNKIIIDFGTVNKILLIKNNALIGAALTPGYATQVKAILKSADKLNDIKNIKGNDFYGVDTSSSIYAGIYNSIYFSTNSFIEEYKKVLGNDVDIFLCGFGAERFKNKFYFKYYPNLTILGIYLNFIGGKNEF